MKLNAANEPIKGIRGKKLSANSKKTTLVRMKEHWELYLVILLPVVYIIVFWYIPMYGAQIAFRDYMVTKGIMGSPWVGLEHFETFFKSFQFARLIKNTLGISLYSIIVGFPAPIILAIAINEAKNRRFKKTVQMVTYAPYFISTVVMVSMLLQLLSPQTGLINNFIKFFGQEPVNFMGKPEFFKSLYVWSGVWQYTGYSAVIYLAALSGIDPTLHEAAIVDGATKLQKIRHIDIPGIMPTIIVLLILTVGHVMNIGFEKIYLMQNNLNMSTSDVISTYVYRIGLIGSQFSFSTAVGLFNSVVNCILLVSVNKLAKKAGGSSLW